MSGPAVAPLQSGPAGRIVALQYLRAIAAIMVVGYHASHYLAYYRKPAGPINLWESNLGMWGVALFFALSGYLMARLAPITPPGRFLLHRIARIYPIYLIAIGVFFALSPLIIGHVFTPRFLPSTLVPVGPAGYTLGVEWTLLYEISFYVMIFLMITAGWARAIPAAAIGWIALIVGWRFAFGEPANLEMPTVYMLPLSSANIAFACGLLIPAIAERCRVHWAWLLAGVAVLLAQIAGFIPPDRIVAGIGSAIIVAAAIATPAPARLNIAGRFGLRLGDASYAIYLVHVPVLVAVLRWLPANASLPTAWSVAFTASIVVGLAFGVADIRIYRLLKRRIDALIETRTLRLAWIYVAFFTVIATWGAATHLIDQSQSARAEAALTLFADNGMLTGAPTAEAINARLSSAGKGFIEPRSGFDLAQRLPDGKLALQGWAIDLAAPDARTWIAAYCDGRQSGWAERTRLRRAEAAMLGVKALAKVRFGFTMATDGAQCRSGALMVIVAADSRGRAHAVIATTVP